MSLRVLHTKLFYFFCFVVVLVIAAVVYYFFFRSASSSPPPQNTCLPPQQLCGTNCCNKCSSEDPTKCSFCNSTDLTECTNSNGIETCCDKNSKCFCIGETTNSCPEKNKNQCCLTSNLISNANSLSGFNECCKVPALKPDGTGTCIDSNGKYLCCPQGSTTDSSGNCTCSSTCPIGYIICGSQCYDANIFCCSADNEPICKTNSETCTAIPGSVVCGSQCCMGACDLENPNYCSACNSADANACLVNGSSEKPTECCYGTQNCICMGGTKGESNSDCFNNHLEQHCCNKNNTITSDIAYSGINECCDYDVYVNNDGKTPVCKHTDTAGKATVNCCNPSVGCTVNGICDEDCSNSPTLISCKGKCWDSSVFNCSADKQALTCKDTATTLCINAEGTIANCCVSCDAKNPGYCLVCDSDKFTKCPVKLDSGETSFNCCLNGDTTCMCIGSTASCSNSSCCPTDNTIAFSNSQTDDFCTAGQNCCCPFTPVGSDKNFCCKNGFDSNNNKCNKCPTGFINCANDCWDETQFTCSYNTSPQVVSCIPANNTLCGKTCCPGKCDSSGKGCAGTACTDPTKVCDTSQRNACCAPDELCACVGGKIDATSKTCSFPDGNTCCNSNNYIAAGGAYPADVCCSVVADPSWKDNNNNQLCCPEGYNKETKMCGTICGNFATDTTISDRDPPVCIYNQGCLLTSVTDQADVPPNTPPYCTITSGSKCNSGACLNATCNWNTTTTYPLPQDYTLSGDCESKPLFTLECNNSITDVNAKNICTQLPFLSSRISKIDYVQNDCDFCNPGLTAADYVRYSYVQGSSACKQDDCVKKLQELGFQNYYFDSTTFECVGMAKPTITPSDSRCDKNTGTCHDQASCTTGLTKLPNKLVRTPNQSGVLENVANQNGCTSAQNCVTEPYVGL